MEKNEDMIALRYQLRIAEEKAARAEAAEAREKHLRRVLQAISSVNQIIIRETNPRPLIEKACACLTEALGYGNCWIVLLNDDGSAVESYAVSGYEENLSLMQEKLASGKLSTCMQKSIQTDAMIKVDNQLDQCPDCPLNGRYRERTNYSRSLCYGGKVFGLITVTVPNIYSNLEEEEELFEQVANDLAYALFQITQQKRKATLEKLLTGAMETTSDGVAVVRLDGRLLEVNEGFCMMTGYRRPELLSMRVQDLDAQETTQERDQRIYRLMAQQSEKFETAHRRKDGSLYPVEVSCSFIPDNGVFVCFCRDISIRKQWEQEVQESEARFRDLLNEIPMVAVQGYLPDGTIHYWNKGGELIYGYTAEEAIGRSLFDLIIPPQNHDYVRKAIQQMVETGEAFPAEEVQLLKKDGSQVTVFTSHWVHDSGEELYSIDIDLTQIRAAEEEQGKLRNQLAKAQRLESIGRLAGGIAHDFNNMLSVIIGHSELLQDEVMDNEELEESVAEIRLAADRSARLTRQLLAFARKQPAAPQIIDLNENIDSMVNMLQRLIGETIELIWEPSPELPAIRIDPSQVDQILANLVVNARDAISGHGTIRLSTTTAVKVRLEADSDAIPPSEQFVTLSVQDDGCGMDEMTLSRIFEPFFTTKKIGKGTGLGLATAYGVVKQNKGMIEVESELGVGTTFQISFPVCRDRNVESREEVIGCMTGDETILLVEDEPAILKLSTRMLEHLHYTVFSTSDANEALRIAREKSEIDLLISDIIMPEIDGRELADQIRILQPQIAVLFMSGYTSEIIDDHGVLDADVNFIQKPFSIDTISQKVRAALAK